VRGRVVELVVHTHHDGDVLVGGGRGDDDLLGAGVDVGAGLGGVGEEPGGLDHDVHTEVAPLQRARVALSRHGDDLVADAERGPVGGHVGVEAAQDRVELQQVRQGGRVGQVVDADDLDVGTRGANGTEEVAADTAEAVDSHADSHSEYSWVAKKGP